MPEKQEGRKALAAFGFILLALALYVLIWSALWFAVVKTFAHPACVWVAAAACALIALCFLRLRRRPEAVALGLASLLILSQMSMLHGLEAYNREGYMRGMLGQLRGQVSDAWVGTGQMPDHLEPRPWMSARIPEHGVSREVQLVDLTFIDAPPTASSGTSLIYMFVAPYGLPSLLDKEPRIAYRIQDGQGNSLSTGTVRVAMPPDFKPDTGTLAYVRKLGAVFINCSHLPRQQSEPWWTF